MIALPYFLTTSLYLLLFYGCYGLLLRRNTFFTLNRVYLLASVLLSLTLPLVELPTGASEWIPIGTITLPTFVVSNATPSQSDNLTFIQWIGLLYGLGAAMMLVRLGLNLRSVFNLIKRGTAVHTPNFTLVRLPDDSTPSFSFGRYLVLNHTDSLTEPDALMYHEEAHIRQHHTDDVLFLEIVHIVFWFNPVIWLYKLALQEIHEFLADRAAIRQVLAIELSTSRASVQPTYAQQLVAYALNVSSTALVTPFVSKSTIKQRIVMLQKPKTHRRALLGYVLILPLAGLLVMCTQAEQDQFQSEAALAVKPESARKIPNVDGEIFTVVEQQPEFQGGMRKLGEYLSQHLKYPEAAQKANAQGKVFVSFIVTKTGEVTEVNLLKGIGYGADKEAIRVVQNMPRWKPGMQNGKAVNVKYNLPINFQLEESTMKKLGIPPPPPPVPQEKKSAFFSFPTNDADILKSYKHFSVNGKEVAFDEFKKYSKADIVEASSSEALIRLETK